MAESSISSTKTDPYHVLKAKMGLKGRFAFARGEEVDQTVFHDVILSLYISKFVYYIGSFRSLTKSMGFKEKDKYDLLEEVFKGYKTATKEEQQAMIATGRILRGQLKLMDVDGGGVDAPPVHFDLLEEALEHPGYRCLNEAVADELGVTIFHAFQHNKIFLYKFDAVDDEGKLVYAMATRQRFSDPNCEDLFVTFRGSVTPKDWYQNMQAPLVDINIRRDKNGSCFLVEQHSFETIPIEPELADALEKGLDGIPIRIHSGFLGYLFDRTESDSGKLLEEAKPVKRKKGGFFYKTNANLSRYQSIKNNLILLFDREDKTTRSCYITGHSLGAALSSLVAFFLSCDLEVKDHNSSSHFQGFKCISFASPLAGGVGFQRAFNVLANYHKSKTPLDNYGSMGNMKMKDYTDSKIVRLRHIRFSNKRDLVPFSVPLTRYRHTGCVHVHVGPSKNLITAEDRMFTPQTSLISGLAVTFLPFLWNVVTTIPIILLFPFFFLEAIGRSLPPWSIFNEFFHAMPASIQEPMGTGIEYAVTILSSKITMAVLWASLIWISVKPSSGATHVFLLVFGFPWLSTVCTYFLAPELYAYLEEYWEPLFVVGILLLQAIVYPIFNSAHVISAGTHSLQDYFKYICRDHEKLSFSGKIFEEFGLHK
mmetsp:Transcript_30126/g.64578  ORF Transcript_30126/g.64578 Transcript_30126/m.64578 type:complete len:651 (-) Transcript_30126:128-2080(-)|eukprot:CAMPEP_0201187112 /NCGR_PEP_ID=MMETSP0851-20130426/132852_1 /ASSEMBLY_ACC=CAM_ASM_000631 /TAXON_ID=183588 /ORGANISM="Pseudo-nitzschia fraudulenta, Strain WWA7" /LENGTH=650 /DNA_ID=CAMNT_0047472545 /DNA_START=79 /DNA_END=2031 /DNA_ORIENTATION=-